MGNQSSTRLGGDDYQHLFSWYEILGLLHPESPYEYTVVEHEEAGAADDLTLHPAPGLEVPARFMQVKWHTNYRDQYGFDTLVCVYSGTRSLLKKLFDSWRLLRDQGPIEVWLVSNWHIDRTLGTFLSDDQRALREELHTSGSREARTGRELWMQDLGATPEELQAFCRDLRFELSFASAGRLETHVDDRMRACGLQEGQGPRDLAIAQIRKRIKAGGEKKRIDRPELNKIIDTLGIRADAALTPEVMLVVQGWERVPVPEPAIEIDWSSYFDRPSRRIAGSQEWEETLLPALYEARERIAGMRQGTYLDFRGKVPLTVALAVGYVFPQVGGFSFRTVQPTGNVVSLWSSHEGGSGRRFIVKWQSGSQGPDVVVGLGVSGNGLPDVERLANKLNADALVYAEPDSGTGQAALEGAADAVALAASAKELILSVRTDHSARQIHLVLYCPSTLALFIGQTLNAVGTIVAYERDGDGEYRASVTLRTR